MQTNDIVILLSSIPIGTIISWIAVLSGIVGFVVGVTIKLYKVFEKTHEIKEENDGFKKLVQSHEEQLRTIQESLELIQTKLDKREESELKKLRYSLIRGMEEYVSKGEITIRQLKSLEDSFEDYHVQHGGNGYVTTMMRKVRALPVIGQLDEDGNDLD